jgi:hypothetical protein
LIEKTSSDNLLEDTLSTDPLFGPVTEAPAGSIDEIREGASFDYHSLTKDEAMKVLKTYAQEVFVSSEKLAALYTVFGIDVFFLLYLLEDSTVRFLNKDKLAQLCVSCRKELEEVKCSQK